MPVLGRGGSSPPSDTGRPRLHGAFLHFSAGPGVRGEGRWAWTGSAMRGASWQGSSSPPSRHLRRVRRWCSSCPSRCRFWESPSPRVTPTNLMYNVISGPGALLRFRRRSQFDWSLTLQLLAGSVPGVVLGSVIRVYVAADPDTFRLLAAAVLMPVGVFILRRSPLPQPGRERPRLRAANGPNARIRRGHRRRHLRHRRRVRSRPHPRGNGYGGRHRRPCRARLHVGHLPGRRGRLRRHLAGCPGHGRA